MKQSRAPQRAVQALVIGGSAGSVEGLSAILPALQPDCGIAVFVVMHLPRERPSLLVNIFAHKCQLRVAEAQDKQPIEPGNIYFAPPDYHLLIDEGPQLALSADELVHFSRPSIDVLFESAADVYADRLIGIVLSGANSDGAAGLRAIQNAGGLTLVQDPKTAVATTMPEAALTAAPGSASLTFSQLFGLLRGVLAGRIDVPGPEGWSRA
jgi:two-component system, chemotaxis family, protein-glutamate methylesterase/glutaminase